MQQTLEHKEEFLSGWPYIVEHKQTLIFYLHLCLRNFESLLRRCFLISSKLYFLLILTFTYTYYFSCAKAANGKVTELECFLFQVSVLNIRIPQPLFPFLIPPKPYKRLNKIKQTKKHKQIFTSQERVKRLNIWVFCGFLAVDPFCIYAGYLNLKDSFSV